MSLIDPSYEDEIDHPSGSKRVESVRSIKDPIHDYIPISPKLAMLIDTKPFQRLRNIKQLGTSYYVWPGASHNRFEHCLGVAYLARSMTTHLQKNQPELGITDRDVECVEIAGLCHDLGHGPWSHVWDNSFIPMALNGSNWTHEKGSEMMFDYLIRENEIPLASEDEKFIKALIAGEPKRCRPDEKLFLFDIVANKRNGLDVDKFDYILRDTYMVGNPVSIALKRIIHSARVLDNQICYDIKDANQIYEICATRFKLHKIIYSHKAAKAIEYMIIDGLLAAEPYLHIANQVYDPEKYLYLTDDIMPRIESSECHELASSRAIFERVRVRDLYKCVDYKVIDWPYRDVFREHITSQRIVDAAKDLPCEADDARSVIDICALSAQDVIVDFSLLHYGMKEKNPLDFVKFYSKRDQNKSAKAGRGDYSNLMPQYHAELLMRVYTKKAEYFGIVQAGYRSVLVGIPDDIATVLREDSITAPTPPATEGPSTPHTHTRTGSSSFISGGGTSTSGTPFSNNSFTTVPPNYVPSSPSRKTKTTKRRRHANTDGSAGETAGTVRRRRG